MFYASGLHNYKIVPLKVRNQYFKSTEITLYKKRPFIDLKNTNDKTKL